MDFEKFTEIFNEAILPQINEIAKENPFIETKNIVLCRKEIYDSYKNLKDLYKKQNWA